MKNTFRILGIIAIVAIIGLAMAGCDLPKNEFPSEFRGTWERAFDSPYTNTLTFTSDTLKASNQSSTWILEDISGDTYTVSQSDNKDNKTTEVIKFVNGNLEIYEKKTLGLDSQDNWNGTWKKR